MADRFLGMADLSANIDIIRRMNDEGIPQRDIAAHLRTHNSTLSVFMYRNRIKAHFAGRPGGRPSVIAERVKVIAKLLAQGQSNTQIGRALGVTCSAVCQFRNRHMGRVKVPSAERTDSGHRNFINAQDWQVADPSAHEPELIARAMQMLGCTAQRAAWLLSCPRGGKAHGWRGGAAIG